MRRVVCFCCVLLLAGCGSSPTAPSRTALPETSAPRIVTRVIDGDTIVVETIGTVRLIGVDTPETVDPAQPVQCFGPEASAFMKETLNGKSVQLDYDVDRTDRFGRTLAYVYLPDGLFLNAELVRQGYGYAYTVFPFRYVDQFVMLERQAKDAKRGLWSACAGA